MDHVIELAHVRDGAYSAATEGGASETIAKILAGHKIGGMNDAYRFFRPINGAAA